MCGTRPGWDASSLQVAPYKFAWFPVPNSTPEWREALGD